MKLASAALITLLTVAGCGSTTSPSTSQDPSASASSRVIQAFDLYTHCGIREAKIGNDFYAASPVLDDGNGNPPAGWGNPGQIGTMTVYSNGTAHFTAPGGLEADFLVRPGATTWSMICS
jgi:hypothetical protein